MTNRPLSQPDEQPAPPPVVRTPVEQRVKAAAPAAPAVQLHREEVGPVAETVGACKRACQGLAYDLRHWKNLPGATVREKVQVATTRGGRLPYLVLTIAVAFLVFFTVLYLAKWAMRGRQESGAPRIMIMARSAVPEASPAVGAAAAAAAPMVGPNLQPMASNVA